MGIKSTHPLYDQLVSLWKRCRDCYSGSDTIKSETAKYLPPTYGQIKDGFGTADTRGQQVYDAYLKRAVFPDLYKESIIRAVGDMTAKPAVIELPDSMKMLEERSTVLGESSQSLLRQIYTHILTTGRLGLLGDFKVVNGQPCPFVSVYQGVTITNWHYNPEAAEDEGLQLVILDETADEIQDDYTWAPKEQYRVLTKATFVESDEDGVAGSFRPDSEGDTYVFATTDGSTMPAESDFQNLEYLGNTLRTIPFAFVNPSDLSPDPDNPPLLGLADIVLTIYMGEADYRQHLFLQGEDTLVTTGANIQEDEVIRTGAGSRIDLPVNADAKYIGIQSEGLAEQREALENDYARAQQKAGDPVDVTSRVKESGDALRRRDASQTVSLTQIALTGAGALESVYKSLAPLFGANPDEIIVTPNLDFSDDIIEGRTFVDLSQAKSLGTPISRKSIHNLLVERGLTKLSYEDEIEEIEGELDELSDADLNLVE